MTNKKWLDELGEVEMIYEVKEFNYRYFSANGVKAQIKKLNGTKNRKEKKKEGIMKPYHLLTQTLIRFCCIYSGHLNVPILSDLQSKLPLTLRSSECKYPLGCTSLTHIKL